MTASSSTHLNRSSCFLLASHNGVQPSARATSRNGSRPSACVASPNKAYRSVFAALLCAVFALLLLVPTTSAQALDIERCTARPNADSGPGVLGATETRITWEGQFAGSESVQSITLQLPDGTSFEPKDTRVTRLSGDDLMTREFIKDASIFKQGETLTVSFAQPMPQGSYIRIEIYKVTFPGDGGTLALQGSYTLSDGSQHAMDGMPSLEVTAVSLPDQISAWLSAQPWVEAWNSNTFLHLFLDPTLMVTSFPVVFAGFLQALLIVAIAFPVAIPCGLLLAILRMANLRLLRAIGTTYVNIVRGTPLFLQIYIAFFGLPLAGVNPPPVMLGVIVLAMNSSAYLCEIFRAGIQSIPKGQFEASRSLGMNGAQTMLFVIIPQTVRRVIPTMTNEFILLYKDTSMLAAVGIMEVVMYAKTIVASTGSITPYIVAAIFYLVITLPLSKIAGYFEARLAAKDGGRSQTPKSKNKRKRLVGGAGKTTSDQAVANNITSNSTTINNLTSNNATTSNTTINQTTINNMPQIDRVNQAGA